MRRFLTNEEGAVTTDWVVLATAIVGLGVAVLSMISTGSLNLANRTADALSNTNVTAPTTALTETSDGDTNFFPWVARTEQDGGQTWAYNSSEQLIDFDTGDLLPVSLSMDESGNVSYTNQRGQATDENGALLQQ